MASPQSLVDTVSRCFNDKTYSDLIVKCGDKSWNLHRVIVCSQSKVLHAACMGGFKEAYTGLIDLDDDDPISVGIMLRYFYTSKYIGPTSGDDKLHQQLRAQAVTYALADKYDVPSLMKLVEQEFASTLAKGPTTRDFLAVISDVYSLTTSANALRGIAVRYARPKFRDIMQGADIEILRETLEVLPEFAFDIIRQFVIPPPLKDLSSASGSSPAVRPKIRPRG